MKNLINVILICSVMLLTGCASTVDDSWKYGPTPTIPQTTPNPHFYIAPPAPQQQVAQPEVGVIAIYEDGDLAVYFTNEGKTNNCPSSNEALGVVSTGESRILCWWYVETAKTVFVKLGDKVHTFHISELVATDYGKSLK